MPVNETVSAVTEKIIERSRSPRRRYLDKIEAAVASHAEAQGAGLRQHRPRLRRLHGTGQERPAERRGPNLGIVTAYNDMLSAHQPFETYPELIREAARAARRHRPGRRRRSGHVRRRDPGRDRHGAVALLARRDRDVDGRGAVAPHVRRGGLSRRLRQDRAGPHHRRALLRPSARRVRSRRPDDERAAQ